MAKKRDVKELELGTAVSKPNLQWEPGIYSMRRLLESFRLPCVIRCDPSHFDLPSDNNTFNIAQPMLLYHQRAVRKLMANNLNYDKSLGKYVEIGDQLLIPEDYKGWFAYFGDPNSITADPGIPVYTTVQNTAASGATKFLVGGTEKIVGLQMQTNKTSQQQRPDSRTVFPGDVFKVSGTYVATTKYTKKKLFRDKIMSREEKFLLCIDEGDREVLLPYDAKEIPVETVLKYNVAKNNEELIQNKGYRSAMVLCKERSEIYMRQIKVSIVMPDVFDDASIYSGPEHVAPSPPLPPTRNRKLSTPARRTDYEQIYIPKPKSTSHLELLSKKVPIQSNANVTLCFGNNAFRIPVDEDGSIRMQRTYRNRPSVAQMFSPPQYDVPRLSPSSFRGSSSLRSIGEDCSDDSNAGVVYENVTLLRRAAKSEISDLPPPLPCRAPMYRMSTRQFNSSPLDNLELGATAFSTSFDTQSVADSGVGTDDFPSSELASQSVNDVQVALKQYGIRDDTLAVIKAGKIDGKYLSKMDLDSLQESFPSVRKLEIRKIALFIESRGQML